MKLFVVYDSKAEVYQSIMPFRNKGEAIRGFAQGVNDPNTQLNKHPEDFTLFEIAEWDEDKGIITPHDTKLSCGLATEFLKGE